MRMLSREGSRPPSAKPLKAQECHRVRNGTRDALYGGMKEKTAIQTKHADCFRSNTPGSPASFLPVFPFNGTIVGIAAINSVCAAVDSTSSLIVDDCETSISILEAIHAVNDSIFH